MKRVCIHCDYEFDVDSPLKKRVGGKINECPECVEDLGGDNSPPRYLGVTAGDGKMSGVTILKFESEKDRESYSKMWKNNSGYNKGKECQLGGHLTSSSGMKFTTLQKTEAVNHKGKL
jgi:hypothetical protein